MERPKILLLTSSLLVDRVFVYTNLIKTLDKFGEVVVWAVSRSDDQNSSVWDTSGAKVENFPPVLPFKSFPYVYLRRLNEFVWDYRHRIPSRESVKQHLKNINNRFSVRALKLPARFLAMCRSEKWLEDNLEKVLLNYPRSDEAEQRLRELKPSVLVVTGAFQFEQPAIFAAAKKLGIPTLAYIPSWDNITTKNRMVFKYDGYLVWSEQIKKELHEFYPATRNLPVYVVGAPQFDIFFQKRFHQTRAEFCLEQNLDPELPLIVYAIGSPNFLKEHYGALEMAKKIAQNEFGKIQMLVRPHPIHDNAQLHNAFDKFAPQVQLQQTHNAGKQVAERSQDERQIREWINTFRHADLVINLSSTVTIDAAIFDKPIINLDFDPQPGQTDQALIYDINHRWNHFKPVAESGGVWLIKNFDELTVAVKSYLQNSSLHRAQRKQIVRYVCEYIDGRCAERMAQAIVEFTELKSPDNANNSCAETKREFVARI